MTARMSTAYLMSAVVHATAIALLLIFAWVVKQQTREPTKIFDLVAGEGNNWAATEAPALGVPNGVKLDVPPAAPAMPKIAEPEPTPVAPTPTPPVPEPVKAQPAPDTPVVPKAPDAKAAPKEPNLVKDIKRAIAKTEQKLAQRQRMEEADRIAQARKDEAARKKAEREAQKAMTKEQYDKLYGKQANPAGKSGNPKVARIDAEGIAGGVVGGSTRNKTGGAGGKALTAAEAKMMDGYFSFLKQQLDKAHEPPPGVSDKLSAVVEFYLAADGTLSQVRIDRTSGNAEFDKSVREAFRRVRSVGPRPDGRSEYHTLTFEAVPRD